MQDEKRLCANCGHDHSYGILRYSPDGVPFYGARKCWCGCDHFVERNIEAEQRFIGQQQEPPSVDINGKPLDPIVPTHQLLELWAKTSFLNTQVPMATRIAVRQIHGLMQGADLSPALTTALTEFAGLVISQVTDIRGAMTRDENKFAHLVAHTDEIVEAMRGVTQLAERLNTIYGAISQIQEQQQKTEKDIAGIAAVLQKLAPDSVKIIRAVDICTRPMCGHLKDDHVDGVNFCRASLDGSCECSGYLDSDPDAFVARQIEARNVFIEKQLKDEPVVVDPDHD